jgi:hypothetical protein
MSTDDTTLNGVVTERDARLRERAAFEAGALFFKVAAPCEPAVEARIRYRISKKVPRVVTLTGGLVSVNMADEGFEFRSRTRGTIYSIAWLSEEDVRILADLLANPFEEVDE